MGQKVNPTSLRLHPQNKHFDSCWFSEKQYAHSIHKDFNVETYYNAIYKQIQYPSASFFFEAAPRKSRISILFLNPAQLRKQAFKQFASSSDKDKRAKENTLFSPRKETEALSFFHRKKNEKEGWFLTFLPPYLLTPPFLQKSEYQVFYQTKTGEKDTVSTLQENKCDIKGNLQSEKNVCSSLLGLVISRYFMQRKRGENLLSATSRFLLLQPFFSFLKIERNPSALPRMASAKPRISSTSRESTSSHLPSHLRNHKQEHHFSLKRVMPDAKILFDKPQSTQAHVLIPKMRESNEKNARLLDTLFVNKKLEKSSSYAYHAESIISHALKNSSRTFLFRAHNVSQNALFIAEEIVYQLQRRNSFRQIQTKLLQELGNKAAIKGIRVTCVGRIGGRAKKAQRARGESFKMGQTSLHLFDSQVSFASKTGLTPFGAVGVKVWVCWK
jgi:ribosomal protein S3